jgi:hypothetical protein
MIDEKKIIENNFDRMREILSNTKLFINVGDTTVGETTLREGDIFRLATALINDGFRLERKGEWKFTEPDTHRNKKPYCSNCGEYHLSSWSDYTNCSYCSNCGAKMIEESAND